jgi:hypothetical protein
MQRVRRGYVDLAIQKVLELKSQSGQIQEAATPLEFNKKVDVTTLAGLSSSHGTEHASPNNTTPPHGTGDPFAKLLDHRIHRAGNILAGGRYLKHQWAGRPGLLGQEKQAPDPIALCAG